MSPSAHPQFLANERHGSSSIDYMQENGVYVVVKVTRVYDKCVDEGVLEVLMIDGT